MGPSYTRKPIFLSTSCLTIFNAWPIETGCAMVKFAFRRHGLVSVDFLTSLMSFYLKQLANSRIAHG